MSDERIERWSSEFNEVLKDQGLFVRDYDDAGKLQPYTAADALHRLLCTMDLKNGQPWLELTVREFVNLYGGSMELKTFHRIETDGARLRSLHARLDAAGGRDVELAEEIDRLEGVMTRDRRSEAEDLEE
jgi:hypothetical protein